MSTCKTCENYAMQVATLEALNEELEDENEKLRVELATAKDRLAGKSPIGGEAALFAQQYKQQYEQRPNQIPIDPRIRGTSRFRDTFAGEPMSSAMAYALSAGGTSALAVSVEAHRDYPDRELIVKFGLGVKDTPKSKWKFYAMARHHIDNASICRAAAGLCYELCGDSAPDSLIEAVAERLDRELSRKGILR